MAEIIMVRHGENHWNDAEIYRGNYDLAVKISK
jgi:bisphosphoglycerate-dependent phosphoglycerate mutase